MGYVHIAHEPTNRQSVRREGLFENLHDNCLKNNVRVSYEGSAHKLSKSEKWIFNLDTPPLICISMEGRGYVGASQNIC